MARDNLINKVNELIYKFKHLDKYQNVNPPLKSIAEFEKVPFSSRDELRGFDFNFYSSPAFNITATSGTTKSRLIVLHSKNCYNTHLKRVMKTYKSIGVKKGDICLNLCSYSLNGGGRIMERAFKEIGVSVIPFGSLNSEERLTEVLELIKKLKPNILNSYTNQLYDIFSALEKEHNLKKCIVNGEPLFNPYKEEIERMSDVRLYNNYGSMEFSGFAISNDDNDAYMELFEDGLYVEVLNDSGKTANTGKGKIVITDLENTCMPFIRYKLGDIVEIMKKGKKKYIKVLGREGDSILIQGEIHSKNELIETVQDFLNHPQFFIIIHKNKVSYKDKIFINIPSSDKDSRKGMIRAIDERLGLGHLIKIRIHKGAIPKTSTGKFKHIIDLRKND